MVLRIDLVHHLYVARELSSAHEQDANGLAMNWHVVLVLV